MKLGRDTGSLVNWIQGNGVIGQPTPVVGMGVTFENRLPAPGLIRSKVRLWRFRIGRILVLLALRHAVAVDALGMVTLTSDIDLAPDGLDFDDRAGRTIRPMQSNTS